MSTQTKEKKSFISKVNDYAQTVASEMHMRALRDGFVTSLPFLFIAGIMILINYVILAPDGFLLGKVVDAALLTTIQGFGARLINGSMNIFSVIVIVLISNSIAKSRKLPNAGLAISVALGAFFITLPMATKFSITELDNLVEVPGAIASSAFGTQTMLIAILCAMLATELYAKFLQSAKFKINMGSNVPEAVTESFNSLFPIAFTLIIFAAFTFFVHQISGQELQELINNTIQKPLLGLTTHPVGFLVLECIGILLFSVGIHPTGVTPFVDPILTLATNENAEAFAAHQAIPHIITTPFRDLYGHIGGTGQTLALVIVIFFLSRRKSNRTFGKMTLPTSIFNINEPIIFGFPIVFNPFMMIPFVLAPMVSLIIAYIATSLDLVSRIVVYVHWSTPPFLNAFFASGGDFRNVILQLVVLVISVFIYIPFLSLYENTMPVEDENGEVEVADDDFSDFADFT
ncbi:PTS lactose transporter subunit IIC [Lactococcus hodotermopsidis]|uniref:Permease IIC component n=1 Tax=Pseudolactococcus hodotermopsidis TaxID=2709157 RepID=A0A6A0BDU8_9LACT|nr:PTS transporter subunit EIIC [Lactococcus hodotermopsidis]GFH42654.1 PTS lactose transporter subunit IIC [Lactococcus hodotermopsidis]